MFRVALKLPVRVINLPLIQQVELAGKKMQMRIDKSVG